MHIGVNTVTWLASPIGEEKTWINIIIDVITAKTEDILISILKKIKKNN